MVNELVGKAISAGGVDNVTAVLVKAEVPVKRRISDNSQ